MKLMPVLLTNTLSGAGYLARHKDAAIMELYCHIPQVIDFVALQQVIEAVVKSAMQQVPNNAKQERRTV
jgi:hypothetical protein